MLAGVLPLGLGRQAPARPVAIPHSVVPAHVDDRVVVEPVGTGVRAARVAPVGAADADPPGRGGERGEQLVRAARNARPVTLSLGDVSGGVDKRGEVGVGNRRGVDRERLEPDRVDRELACRQLAAAGG